MASRPRERQAKPPGGAGVQQLAFVGGVVAIFACWPIVRYWIPPGAQFDFRDLVREHIAHRSQLEPWLGQRWAWLADHNYHWWFTLACVPGALAIGIVQSLGSRRLAPLLLAPAGWAGGLLIGYWLFQSFAGESWPAAVAMPAIFSFLGGAVAARLGAPSSAIRHIRGTMIGPHHFGPLKRWSARRAKRVILAGVPLSHDDEAMHVAAIGATGSGKSTALRGLMDAAFARGDRHVVADPEGTAMASFCEDGDIVLNPFHPRCAKWDILAEIERPSDHAFVAQSILPHLGVGEHDQWITYAQQLLAGIMENFVRLELGTSDDLIEMLSSARIGELKELCAGTPAARYFEEGGERMLASILGTLAPAIGSLRSIAAIEGPPFSVKQWVRSGTGSLWMPYSANQIAAARGLISCWLNLAIMETLSLEPSDERRIWFHIDELDALGRIDGLKDALARLRKFGGCVALGFQSYSQVKQIYGDGAHTIIENCGNLLLLRAGGSEDGGTAKLASDLIGSREVERHEISQSRTRGKHVSRSSSAQVRRDVELAALASELGQLRSGAGYLKRASSPEWIRIGRF